MPKRLAVDIGGTFTDLVLEIDGRRLTKKVLTTPTAPERAVMDGVREILAEAKVNAGEIEVFIHGTTLATNAIIERKGARTALIATDGFRDTLDIAYESRYDQYDVFIDKPPALVGRQLRFTVPERVDATGKVLKPLDEAAVRAVAAELKAHNIESVAVALMHSYVNPAHERRIGEIVAAALPGVSITLSADVCPEIREYERTSTTCANAYVQPLMAGYLARLKSQLGTAGFACPLYLMTSGGGITTIETAMRFPIRLVESGPAGGAILAAHVAAECCEDRILSFDMGGTTAKVCLITDAQPQSSRSFEVDRAARFLKGSGLPLRIPVIEMVEIGAGGGSIARIDAMRRIVVGPDSAGAEPGPACYGRGGTNPTVTDSDVVLGKIDPSRFAAGKMALDVAAAEGALSRNIGQKLNLPHPRRLRRDGNGRREHGQCRARALGRARHQRHRSHAAGLRRRGAAARRKARGETGHQAHPRAHQCRRRLGSGLPARPHRLRSRALALYAAARFRAGDRQRHHRRDAPRRACGRRSGRRRQNTCRDAPSLYALCRPGP